MLIPPGQAGEHQLLFLLQGVDHGLRPGVLPQKIPLEMADGVLVPLQKALVVGVHQLQPQLKAPPGPEDQILRGAVPERVRQLLDGAAVAGAVGSGGLLAPEALHDLVNGHGTALPVQAQGHQLLGLGGAETDRLPVHQHIEGAEGAEEKPLALPPAQELGPLHDVGDVLPVKGLEDHVVRLHPQGVHGELGMGRGKDDDDVAPDLPQALGQLHAVHAGHVDVQQSKVHHMAGGIGDGLVGVREFAHDLKVGHVGAFQLEQLQVQQHVVHQDGLQSASPPFSM